MDSLTHSESVVVARSPEELYDLVSDITRMGEWSPQCKSCWWDEGDSSKVGAKFTGRNEDGDSVWETHCTVETAERPSEFGWVVGDSWVRWSYRFAPADGGTTVTESWEFTPAGQTMFQERMGENAPAAIAAREQAAHAGIPATLAAIKAAAESA